uniref:AMP-dependent synthetase/ligase domain-containing protein n=1 Tax=Moniliophthora roreri TaxID=221103 RepID=A0A0W0FQT6_MONRR
MNNYFEHSRLLWKPQDPESTNVEQLRLMINRTRGTNLKDFHDLHKYSVEDYNFWLDLWRFFRIISSESPRTVLEPGIIPEIPTWFPGARLNYAENLLWRNDEGVACTACGESGKVVHYTFRELREDVARMASAMRANGLVVGDRVAAIITNSFTAVTIALATASIGAVFSSTATDMGTQGILDRYRQIQPKLVFAETEVLYAGKTIDLMPKVIEVIKDLNAKGLSRAILLPSTLTEQERPTSKLKNAVPLHEFLSTGKSEDLVFEQLPFNQPLFILYSSGTSGPPKCIGILMQTRRDINLGLDVKYGETYFQYTTTGWMMWTFMLATLSIGSRIILYDGSPFHPDARTYLKFINDQGVTQLGTSPRFLAEIQGQGIKPMEIGIFKSLRILAVTGAVLTPPLFEWAFHAFGSRLHLTSMSGGTDICCGLVGSNPSGPVYVGEIQAKALGMKVEVFDPDGKNIEHTGEPGELVCTRPHPSLPIKFWGDTPDGKKLRETYFSFYSGIWRQGDFIVMNPVTKGFIMLGRRSPDSLFITKRGDLLSINSDGVLNPSGVRFGSGEIYTVLESFSSHIDDSICVGQRRPGDKDERVLLFLKMRLGHPFTKVLENEICNAIRKSLSARHVPAYIFEVEDIPYTVNGKKIEIAVKQIVSGSSLKPSGTVANPESMQLYYKYRNIEKVNSIF